MDTTWIPNPGRISRFQDLPPCDQSAGERRQLLLVSLTDLSDANEEKLIQHLGGSLEDAKFKIWHPSKFLLESIAHQGRDRDSQENIYGVAILAYRAGWSSFIVADELTKRQLDGNLRVGEEDLVSAVMVATVLKAGKQNGVRVIARRTVGTEEEDWSIFGALGKLKSVEDSRIWADLDIFAYSTSPRLLHDPDRPIFAFNSQASLGREKRLDAIKACLMGHYGLPIELVTDIISRSDEANSLPVAKPIGADYSEDPLIIFLLFPTTSEEFEQVHSVVQQAVQTYFKDKGEAGQRTAIHLVRWEYGRVASRRDLTLLWDRYRLEDCERKALSLMHFLLERPKDIDSIKFATGYMFPTSWFIPAISRSTISKVINGSREWRKPGYIMDYIRPDDLGDIESLDRPTEPFYINPPPWLPARIAPKSPAVFYLTNKLTESQDQIISAELQTKPDYIECGPCCFVPWKKGKAGEVDGTVEDIWDIVFEVYTNEWTCRHDFPLFFIDRQSGADQTVIMVVYDIVSSSLWETARPLKKVSVPQLRGFLYVRIPSGATKLALIDNILGQHPGPEDFEENRFYRREWRDLFGEGDD